MHELAIADAVVEIACRHAGDRTITRVEVKVGHLRQVVPDALTFAFSLVAEGTRAEGAEVAIEEVPPAGWCRACDADAALAGFPLQCANCRGVDIELVRGEELLVDAIELEEETVMTSGVRGHGD